MVENQFDKPKLQLRSHKFELSKCKLNLLFAEYKKYEESYKIQKERQNIEISRIIERIVRDERLMIDLRNFIYYRQATGF